MAFYLGLTDGTTTLDLSSNDYAVGMDDPWIPSVQEDVDQPFVVESIPLDVLSMEANNPAYEVRKNLSALTTMLRQIKRGQNAFGGVVNLLYKTANSAPECTLASQLSKWVDPKTYLGAVNNPEQLVTNEAELLRAIVERKAPWRLLSYAVENLAPTTSWTSTPSQVGAGLVGTWSAITGYYGGKGQYQLSKPGALPANGYISTVPIAVTNGQPVTISACYQTAGLTQLDLLFVTIGPVAGASNLVNLPVSGYTDPVTSGNRITATLTPTVTGTVYLYFQVYGAAGAYYTFSEIMVESGLVATTWHPKTSDFTQSVTMAPTVTTAAQQLLFPIDSPAPAPANVTMANTGVGTNGIPTNLLFLCSALPITVRGLPYGSPSAPFSSVADAAGLARSTNVLRYTPTVINNNDIVQISDDLDVIYGNTVYRALHKRLQFFVWARNNSSTASFTIKVRCYITGQSYIDTEPVTIAPHTGTAKASIYKLGEISYQDGFRGFRMIVSGSVVGQTIDFDQFVIASIDDVSTVILTGGTAEAASNTVFEHGLSTRPIPFVGQPIDQGAAGIANFALPTTDNTLVRHKASQMYIFCDGTSTNGSGAYYWRLSQAGVAVTPTATVTLLPAYDSPV